MENREDRWRRFGAIVVRLTRGENISREEARECWRQVCEEEQSDLQQGGFIAALKPSLRPRRRWPALSRPSTSTTP